MRRIFVMEERELGKGLCAFLAKAGYEVILATTQDAALMILNDKLRIDFVISAGLRWKSCYEFAILKYGITNVVVCTGDQDVKKDLEYRHVMVFEKPFLFDDLVAYVVKVCPPK